MSMTPEAYLAKDPGPATLGFGTSRLLGGFGRRQSRRVIDAAFDAGIRHFDTAPSYGEGASESVLGELLAGRRDEVTIASKYGLLAPVASGQRTRIFAVGRNLARPLVRTVPVLRAQADALAARVAPEHERASFTASDARRSLERSLRVLRTDRVDLWLLHEVSADALVGTGQALVAMLEAAQQDGAVRRFGVGSNRSRLPSMLDEWPQLCQTVQCEWSVRDAGVFVKARRIHHSCIRSGQAHLASIFAARPGLCEDWSREIARDLADREVVAPLLLKAALEVSGAELVLFSTRDPRRIAANVGVAHDRALAGPARRLWSLSGPSSNTECAQGPPRHRRLGRLSSQAMTSGHPQMTRDGFDKMARSRSTYSAARWSIRS